MTVKEFKEAVDILLQIGLEMEHENFTIYKTLFGFPIFASISLDDNNEQEKLAIVYNSETGEEDWFYSPEDRVNIRIEESNKEITPEFLEKLLLKVIKAIEL